MLQNGVWQILTFYGFVKFVLENVLGKRLLQGICGSNIEYVIMEDEYGSGYFLWWYWCSTS